MKLTTYEKTTEIELDETSYKVGSIDILSLLKALRVHSSNLPDKTVAIEASAATSATGFAERVQRAFGTAVSPGLSIEAGEEREATGEDILALVEAQGGDAVVERDADGVITSIHASIAGAIVGDPVSGKVDSIQATGPAPAKLLGDLAQTSVGAAGSETQVIGLAEWTIDWKRKTADATTTDDATYESSLGSTASWSVKAKYMFIDGDPTQSTNILATITTPTSPQQWNFFPTIATGRAAFSGNAYVDGITIASGMGKVVGLDISLKGTGRLNVLSQTAPVANAATVTGQQAEV